MDRDFYLDMFAHVTDGSPIKGYEQRMKRHYEWVKSNKKPSEDAKETLAYILY